ncbi:conserved hypothetical protein [Talaromyces stipitatus ATCC 10500]|uniref:EthD domain-containing protein n=1 Tax=Talaromyces stipitatus (strain ATCC 10500 / CBS 375.48 / QM 6759 / NRRL 1006) TaxID=441959 RepID=B8ME43_TALSN|nr:uncharacterized protein TSTA_012290 [Talaromyces stipitatus ATCC 10500]EED16120.1 conserved hypothetical protein [Talaromyces stipitatus ATCC 10500]
MGRVKILKMPVRAVLILYRKPGLSPEQFKTHCENHVQLIKRLTGDDSPLSHRRSYIARKELGNDDDKSKITTTERNPTTPAEVVVGQQSDFDFDAYAELTFASQEAVRAYRAKTQVPEIAAEIAADEEKFMDRAKMSIAFLGDIIENTKA